MTLRPRFLLRATFREPSPPWRPLPGLDPGLLHASLEAGSTVTDRPSTAIPGRPSGHHAHDNAPRPGARSRRPGVEQGRPCSGSLGEAASGSGWPPGRLEARASQDMATPPGGGVDQPGPRWAGRVGVRIRGRQDARQPGCGSGWRQGPPGPGPGPARSGPP